MNLPASLRASEASISFSALAKECVADAGEATVTGDVRRARRILDEAETYMRAAEELAAAAKALLDK